MPENGEMPRRAALAMGAVGVSAAGLAALSGCALGGTPDPLPSGQPGSDRPGSDPGPGSEASGRIVSRLDDVPIGGVAAVTISRNPAFVARPDAQTVRAFSAICTHRSCTVLADGETLLCPCHGSRFELLTGAVLRGPAAKPLPPIPVRVQGEDVVTG